MKRIAALHGGGGIVDSSGLLAFLLEASLTPTAADERSTILAAFERSGGNKSRMAEMMHVSRKTLYARIKRLGLDLS